jgi:hypothetical protein
VKDGDCEIIILGASVILEEVLASKTDFLRITANRNKMISPLLVDLLAQNGIERLLKLAVTGYVEELDCFSKEI